MAPGRMNHVGLDHQILVDEFGRIGVVGMDAAHLCRRQDHVVDRVLGKPGLDLRLVGQVAIGTIRRQHLNVPAPLQLAHDGRADHPAMPGHKYPLLSHDDQSSSDTSTSWPLARRKALRRATFKSSATISVHIWRTVISGDQPRRSRALVGSPSRVSTSAGRK